MNLWNHEKQAEHVLRTRTKGFTAHLFWDCAPKPCRSNNKSQNFPNKGWGWRTVWANGGMAWQSSGKAGRRYRKGSFGTISS